jgi:hypothetical protein
MACLLYGDSLGLHPSTSLTDIHVINGRVGISGALMLAKIRDAGHKITFEWIEGEIEGKEGLQIVGVTAKGQRIVNGEVEDEDEWTYTLDDARQAGLLSDDPKAAWFKTPKVMLRWRALAQLTRFLFSDVFRSGSVYIPDEAEEIAYSERRLVNGTEAAPAQTGDAGIEYGDDPLLAAWLVSLFAMANDVEPGTWLPKKQQLALRGKTQEDREALAQEIVDWIEERNLIAPERPVEDIEEAEEADFTVLDDPERGVGTPASLAETDDEAIETRLD